MPYKELFTNMEEKIKEVRGELRKSQVEQSRKWQPTPVFLPGKFHGQKNLVSYSSWGHRVGHD